MYWCCVVVSVFMGMRCKDIAILGLQLGQQPLVAHGSQYMAHREAIAKFFFATGTAPELAGAPAFDEMVDQLLGGAMPTVTPKQIRATGELMVLTALRELRVSGLVGLEVVCIRLVCIDCLLGG